MTRFTTLFSALGLTFAFMLANSHVDAGWWSGNLNFSTGENTRKEFFMIPVINQNQFEGNWKQLKGALKEKWGDFTDDDLLAIAGNLDRFEGKLQERYGDRQEEVNDWVDKWFQQHSLETQSKTGK